MAGESSLKKMISHIDDRDEVGLRRVLEDDNSEINQYYDMPVEKQLAVRMTPLQFAVKVKAPKCVEVLLDFGADIKMKLKTPENKSLPITALALAEGERDVAQKNDRVTDIAIYDVIVQLIKDHEVKKKKKKRVKKDSEPKLELHIDELPGKHGKDSSSDKNEHQVPIVDITTTSSGSVLAVPTSPTSVVDMHKLTLKATQNQMAIKKLEERNELLQKEIDEIRRDMELMKKVVLSLDLSPTEKIQLENTSRRKTMGPVGNSSGPSKVSSERNISKSKPVEKKELKGKSTPKNEKEKESAPANDSGSEDDIRPKKNSALHGKKTATRSNTSDDKPSSKRAATNEDKPVKKRTKKSQS